MQRVKLANFTLHDQTHYILMWKRFGFDLDPTPRAPLIRFEKEEWTEERILEEVKRALTSIKEEGFEAIIIGGLSNVMAYAWYLASQMGLRVIMAKTPRLRTPDGKFVFVLMGLQELLDPIQVLEKSQKKK